MIGTPPPTLASKPTARPCLPASRKFSPPCSASNALLPVTTPLPAANAFMMSARAGSWPPNNSTTISISGCVTSVAASRVISFAGRPGTSSGLRLRSATPASSSGAPRIRSYLSGLRSSSLTTPPPTVPHPSRAIRTGFNCSPMLLRLGSGAAGRADGNCGVTGAQRVTNSAERLAGAMLVLDQREAYEAVAVLTEAHTRRDRDLGLGEQELRELERAHRAERLRNRRPHEHRRLGLLDRPSGAVEPIDQHVAPILVGRIDLGNAFLRSVERGDCCNLHRREHPVVEVRLQPPARRYHLAIADREADAPSRHVVALREREELDADIFRAGHLHHRRRLVAVEAQVRVREILRDHDVVFARELDHPIHEMQIDRCGGRVVREIHDEELGPRPASIDRRHQLVEKFFAAPNRHALHLRARNDASVLMDRIGRGRREHHVALVENRKRQMRDALLRADRDDRFRIGIELDAVAALVPIANRQPQLVYAARYRVPMIGVLGGRLDQLRHDMRRRRLVRIPHPEIDYVLTGAPRLQAQLSNRVEDVRWQPLDSWEIHRAISFNGPPSTPLVVMRK